MQRTLSNAVPSAASMRPGLSQESTKPSASRQTASRFAKPAPGSVSRSEAGVSIDLSVASNTAANGEEAMEAAQQVSGTEPEQKPEQPQKSQEADRWFEDANRNASTRGNVSFVDDDPPFHLPSNIPHEFSNQGLPVRVGAGFQMPSSYHQMHSLVSSGSEEFRSVIDDLTVENKKLKKENSQLKRHQTLHTHPDKLFEVRMLGLDAKEKKKLMHMLRDFNESIANAHGETSPKAAKKHSKGSSNKPSSSSTLHSNSIPVDSAYASGSTSGNASGSQSQMADSRTNLSAEAAASRKTYKDQNVRSYLENMSQGLLPKQPAVMTEMARKKLVVRKLEQLYTGKPNTTKRNSQSQQQQQVSNDAADEQRQRTEAVGRSFPIEGSREAMIHPSESESAMPQPEQANPSPVNNQESAVGTPDQRPTRPLDLDLSRAQNPAENIAYIRHLGFSSSRLFPGQAGAEGAWVPLYLLMNMAQLHTLNVTPSFVRQALGEISDRFEISSSGHKVRWTGGTEGTRMSGDSGGGSSSDSKDNSPSDLTQDPSGGRAQSPSRSRGSKPSDSDQATGAIKSSGPTNLSGTKVSSRDIRDSAGMGSGTHPSGGKRPVFLGSVGKEDSFSYQPIFLHAGDEENDYLLDEDDSALSSGMREDTTGSGSGQKTQKINIPGKEEGAVIFYNRAKFCTDLSGDHDAAPLNTTRYTRETAGGQVGAPLKSTPIAHESKGLISASKEAREAAALNLSDLTPIHIAGLDDPIRIKATPFLTDTYPMYASGIGNTAFADNLALWPKYTRSICQRSKPVADPIRLFIRSSFFGPELLKWIPKDQSQEILLKPNGCPRRELTPSDIPSPGFYNQWSSSESATGLSDDEDGEAGSKSEHDAASVPDVPPTFGYRVFQSHSGEDDSDDEREEDDADADDADQEDSDEIDMLAYERQLNAEDIARREREWDEQAASGAGDDDDDNESKRSSAATVGDRSFLSDDEAQSPVHGAALAGQKRGRDEQVPPDSSPAKRVETPRTRHGKR